MASNFKEPDLAASFQKLRMDESRGRVIMTTPLTFEDHSQRSLPPSNVVQHGLPIQLETKMQEVNSIPGNDRYHVPLSRSQWNQGTAQDDASRHQQTQRHHKAFTSNSSDFPGKSQTGKKYPNSKLHKAVNTHQGRALSQNLHNPIEGSGNVRRSKRLRDKAQNRNVAEVLLNEPASSDHVEASSNHFGASANHIEALPRLPDQSLHYGLQASTSRHSTSNILFGGLQVHPSPPQPSTQVRSYHTNDLRGPKHSQGNQKIDNQSDEPDIHPTQQLFEHLNLVAQQRGLHSVTRSAVPSPKNKKSTLSSIPDPIIPTKPPEPTPEYLEQASRQPRSTDKPQTLLIVLDINGTLVDRIGKTTKFVSRPDLDTFRQYCLENHRVMIWSSAMPINVDKMCKKIFTPAEEVKLVAIWSRNKLNLTSHEYKEKVQVYKRLEGIWDDQSLQMSHPEYASGGRWSQANTILIDDSVAKAAAQPFNHIEVPEFFKHNIVEERRDKVLASVIEYLEQARTWLDVSSFIAKHRFLMWNSSAKDTRAVGRASQS